MTQKICDKTLCTYSSRTNFLPESYKTQEICNKTFNICLFLYYSIPDWCKVQEMCYRVVSEDLYLIVYCSDQYNFQIMCNITADYSAAALKLIPNWFVTSKMMKNLFTALYTDESFLRF